MVEMDTSIASKTFTSKLKSKSKGFSFMEIYAAIVASVSFLCIGLLRAYTSPAISSMQKKDAEIFSTSSLSKKEILSWFASSPPLASLIGTIISGPLLEYFGRKTTIVILTIPYIIGWLLIGFAQDIFMVLSGRILTGIAAGISTAAAQLYVSECVRPEVRGTLGFLPSMMLALGVLLGFAASTIDLEWRALALIMLSFPVALLVMSLTVPESPPWLILRGNEEKAVKNLRKFRGNLCIKDDIDDEIGLMRISLLKQRRGWSRKQENSGSYGSGSGESSLINSNGNRLLKIWWMMKQRGIWLPAIIGITLMIFQQFSGANVVIFFLVVILTEAEPVWNEDQVIPVELYSVIVALVQFLAFFLSLPLIDRMGRKLLLISSAILMALPLALLGFYFYCNVNAETNEDLQYIVNSTCSWLPLTCLCIFIGMYSIGMSSVPFILMSEIFPSHARSYLCSLTSFANHFFLFIVIKMFPMLVDWFGPHWTCWMFAGSCLLSVFFVVFVVFETKNKTLGEIEQHFANDKEIVPLIDRSRNS